MADAQGGQRLIAKARAAGPERYNGEMTENEGSFSVEISIFDEQAAPFEATVALDAGETDALIAGAYARLARVLKCSEADARNRARDLLTERELSTFLTTIIMARAGVQALAEAGPMFIGEPRTSALEHLAEHAPFRFRVSAHPLPAMNLDTQTPIDCANKPERFRNLDDEAYVAEVLRARLNGTIPDALMNDALTRHKDAFMAQLGEQGLTYREYRIEHGEKPQDVQDMLYDEAFDELSRDIALDMVFAEQGLRVAPADEQAVLSESAPGREEALREEFEETGRMWMLQQKARRAVALKWAVDHLASCAAKDDANVPTA